MPHWYGMPVVPIFGATIIISTWGCIAHFSGGGNARPDVRNEWMCVPTSFVYIKKIIFNKSARVRLTHKTRVI